MANLKVALTVQVPSPDPAFKSSRKIAVENYEPFDFSIPPNKSGDASLQIDLLPKSTEGPIKLLVIKSNIYPMGDDAGEIKLTVGETLIKNQPLHEPLFLLGTQLIKTLGKIDKISFVNTYKPKAPAEKAEAEEELEDAKKALNKAEESEKSAKQKLKDVEDPKAKDAAKKVKEATDKVTEAKKLLRAAEDKLTKSIAAIEKEIVDHTAKLSILIGNDSAEANPSA